MQISFVNKTNGSARANAIQLHRLHKRLIQLLLATQYIQQAERHRWSAH